MTCSARFQRRKLLEARTEAKRTQGDKAALDEEIKEEYGEEKMRKWRKEEEAFLDKMMDIKKHKEIEKSVYDTDQEQRVYYFWHRKCRLTKLGFLLQGRSWKLRW